MNELPKKALFVIDMQNDFITGCLGSKYAQSIVPTIQNILETIDEDTICIFTQDTHSNDYLQTQEGKNLPVPHCIQHTKGHEIIPELSKFVKHKYQKNTFGSITLANNYKQQLQNVSEIILVGLCTDICVISNALILKAILPETKITIYENACAGTTPENHEAALQIAKSCQISIKTYMKGE